MEQGPSFLTGWGEQKNTYCRNFEPRKVTLHQQENVECVWVKIKLIRQGNSVETAISHSTLGSVTLGITCSKPYRIYMTGMYHIYYLLYI